MEKEIAPIPVTFYKYEPSRDAGERFIAIKVNLSKSVQQNLYARDKETWAGVLSYLIKKQQVALCD